MLQCVTAFQLYALQKHLTTEHIRIFFGKLEYFLTYDVHQNLSVFGKVIAKNKGVPILWNTVLTCLLVTSLSHVNITIASTLRGPLSFIPFIRHIQRQQY